MNKRVILTGLLAATLDCSSTDSPGGSGGGATAGHDWNGGGNAASGGAGPSGEANSAGDARTGSTTATGGAVATGGTRGGGSDGACVLPSCLSALACTPSGTCTFQEAPETGSTAVAYPNGVTQTSLLSVTDYSTALTVKNGETTCFSTAYIGNDFWNAADKLTVKNAAGKTVATLMMDTASTSFLITCAGAAQPVSVPKSCSKLWPLAGLTTLPASTCTAPATGEAGGAGGAGGAAGAAGGNGAGSLGTGGTSDSGEPTVVAPVDPSRVRAVVPLDRDWRFHQGQVSGAEKASFADGAWRSLNVPHDWSIEGPFSESAPTTGRGGYVPTGIGWYRKHFTLPQTLSGRKVYVEFDGVMENSTVYVNGVQLGNHPYGYTSFRYDMTANVNFGTTENVLAVKVDTSLQPNSRYYAGSGIYRHVRVLAADPVHVDQWATYVTTPSVSTTSATVHVETTVVNSGTAAASVTVQGSVSPLNGTALAPVATPAQNIAAGASAKFTFDVAVANPKLWSPDAPNLYQLLTHVLVDNTAVDDDQTTFGIRSLVFDAATGLSINGKATKFQGACLHQDYHGLGMAAPQRAMQRRLAQLKSYGINAIRTAHDPPSPDFLDLCDRMGILVMNEFFDVWTGHKYSDVGDHATYFNKAAGSPTGEPAVPDATAPKWYEAEVTGIVMRDRNHPSVAIYSAGNEIRDSLATRTPILTRILAITHALDPSRPVSQGLFRPSDSGDITGATRTLLDVFGGNYRADEVLTAMKTTPARAGVLTEMGTETATWSKVKANAALTGSFMWTGVDYLGEADGAWPTVGTDFGMLDAMGTPKSVAFSWQTTLGLTKTTFSTGVQSGKVVLTADHTAITTDLNDVAYVKAAVPTATAPVTFAVAGPGAIVAVDSGSMTQESFRGTTRNAYGGLAFAIVQATGVGTITVTATSSGLTAGTATIQATDGVFVPCSGSCD